MDEQKNSQQDWMSIAQFCAAFKTARERMAEQEKIVVIDGNSSEVVMYGYPPCSQSSAIIAVSVGTESQPAPVGLRGAMKHADGASDGVVLPSASIAEFVAKFKNYREVMNEAGGIAVIDGNTGAVVMLGFPEEINSPKRFLVEVSVRNG